jgi:ATP-dependent protease HslVU (ClpYQ) ATPase subunit
LTSEPNLKRFNAFAKELRGRRDHLKRELEAELLPKVIAVVLPIHLGAYTRRRRIDRVTSNPIERQAGANQYAQQSK